MAPESHTLQSAIDAMPHAVLLVNAQGRVCQGNQQAADLLGYALEQLTGQWVESFMPEDIRERHRAQRNALPSHKTVKHMVPASSSFGLNVGGLKVPVEISLGKVFWADGEPLRIVMLMERQTNIEFSS